MTDLKISYLAIKERIAKAKRNFEITNNVELLAVSKTHSVDKISALANLGQKSFGESYLQEALPKIAALPDLEWHFIGPMQSNKTREIAENFDWVQSVDRLKIAQRLNDQRPLGRGALNILLQVNLAEEETKSGLGLNEVTKVAEAVQSMENLRLRGIMAIPPRAHSFADQAKDFAAVRKLYLELKQKFPALDSLSMGMSADLEAAIAQGSTCVRVGTDIFGEREEKKNNNN